MESCIEHNQKLDYGCTTVNGKGGIRLHRVAYCKHNNVTLEDIKGLVVRHLCNNPRCINPLHLEIGTHQDNMDDMVKSGRSAKGSKARTAKLTPEVASAIRSDTSGLSQRALATKYGVSQSTINAVLRGTRW